MASHRLRAAAARHPEHPALRWTPHWQPEHRAQHRRADDHHTACGLTGTLVLAEPSDTYCATCFPDADQRCRA